MGFKIDKVLPEDVKILGDINMEVSTSSPRIVLAFKDCQREDVLEWYIKGIQAKVARCAKYPQEATALKAVDEETGEIAGWAIWGWSTKAADLIIKDQTYIDPPPGANYSLRQSFTSRLMKLEAKNRPQGVFYELCELIVSPRYQRRGLGSLLVKYGIERADRDNFTCFLTGSPMGVPVYQKLGFEEVERLEFGLAEFGGEGVHVHVAMIRKPVVTTLS